MNSFPGGTMNLFSKITLFALLSLLLTGLASAADTPRFDVNRYQVDGNSLLPAEQVESILAPFTGKGSDFGTLQQAVEALEKAYRSGGFHAVRVMLPEQELKGGVVRITVYEARIGVVTIEGNKHFDTKNIRSAIPALNENTVPNLDKISMNIRVANENPARKMQLLLQNGDNSQTLNALLKVVDEKPWKVGVSLDDTGNDQTGTLRLGFNLQHANLFNLDHLATFQYTTSPEKTDRVSVYTLGYRIPLYSLGDSIDLYGGYSDVNSGTATSGILSLNVSGKGMYAGVRYNQNLTRMGSYEHRILYGFDYRRFENNTEFKGIPGLTPLNTTVEAIPISIGYAGSYAFGRGSEISAWTSVSQNIPGGDKGDSDTYRRARSRAEADATILRAGATLNYVTLIDVQARFVVSGQYTEDSLIPGEQFGMGGQNSLRGFGERELSDDIGIAGSLEIYSPNIMKYFQMSTSSLRALAFYDAGYLERNDPQPGEPVSRNAASTGVGLRLAIDRYLSASTDYAIVVGPQGHHSSGSARWHFKINLMF
jgi:hemolysin activation/secretion protein